VYISSINMNITEKGFGEEGGKQEFHVSPMFTS